MKLFSMELRTLCLSKSLPIKKSLQSLNKKSTQQICHASLKDHGPRTTGPFREIPPLIYSLRSSRFGKVTPASRSLDLFEVRSPILGQTTMVHGPLLNLFEFAPDLSADFGPMLRLCALNLRSAPVSGL